MRRIGGMIIGGCCIAAGVAWAQSFPGEAVWRPVERNGVALGDAAGDATGARDVVGDADAPAAFVARDEAYLYFRLRVNDTPCRSGSVDADAGVVTDCRFKNDGWGVEIDTDGNPDTYEILAIVDATSRTTAVRLEQNTAQKQVGDPSDQAEITVAAYALETAARVVRAATAFGQTPDYFLEWRIALADLRRAPMALADGAPMRFVFGASAHAHNLSADLAGPGDALTLADLYSDGFRCDDAGCTNICAGTLATDGDGLCDAWETHFGTDPTRGDSDGDGIGDGAETAGGSAVDTDGDGVIDALDTDSDNDGIGDAEEWTAAAQFGRDIDQDGLPNWQDADSDGDGTTDQTEGTGDADADGIPNLLDANDADGATADSDADGLPNGTEDALATNPLHVDTDSDRIGDFIETDGGLPIDTEQDGLIDARDVDSDNDGLSDTLESGLLEGAGGATAEPKDTDGDGTKDFRDLDSDNDGLSDAEERIFGTDPTRGDSDGDGLTDAEEFRAGTLPLVPEPQAFQVGGCQLLPSSTPHHSLVLSLSKDEPQHYKNPDAHGSSFDRLTMSSP